jgi:uncharacterized repeat protein (TIGR03987 family)
MLVIAIVFISSALVLYSVSIWSERISKGLKPWMVKTFISAFACDLIGTSIMFCQATDRFQLNLHSSCGYAALVIMGLHLVWALIALRYHGPAEKNFHRFSIMAWTIWLVAFLSGVPRA